MTLYCMSLSWTRNPFSLSDWEVLQRGRNPFTSPLEQVTPLPFKEAVHVWLEAIYLGIKDQIKMT